MADGKSGRHHSQPQPPQTMVRVEWRDLTKPGGKKITCFSILEAPNGLCTVPLEHIARWSGGSVSGQLQRKMARKVQVEKGFFSAEKASR